MVPKRGINRTTDCEKYLKWKAERAQKLQKKKKVKKRKKKEPVLDCVDEDEIHVSEDPQVPKTRKCKDKKRKKKKKPSRLIRKIYKHIPYGELLVNCIKPSLEDREYLINPIHARCLGLDTTKLSFKPEIPQLSQTYVVRRKKSVKMRFPCSKGKRKPKRYPKTLKEQEEDEDSECDSICSFDSEICLTGVRLTAKDMEEIKKYQRDAEESKAKLQEN
ncbi:uncharacterized protein LOC113465243 [Ceratina calcarata]|uniref:Uncharacterized protein LOC113465243 n=1 Tax=Ceratina calcarata TaxID=156304 RepID=A0AAJ7SCG6_9HYME|nr:uncharacterized protein LOC113465243 [Ceratina calcarata]